MSRGLFKELGWEVNNVVTTGGPGEKGCLNFPGKNTGAGCHSLLQGIFLTQGLKLCLWHPLYWQVDSSSLAPPGKPSLTWMFQKHKTSCGWNLNTQPQQVSGLLIWFWAMFSAESVCLLPREGAHLPPTRCNLAETPARLMKWWWLALHPRHEAYFAWSGTIH